MDLDTHLQQRLGPLRTAGLWRNLRIRDGLTTPVQQVDGRPVVAFCSNDYLGLAADPRLRLAVRRTLRTQALGAGAAHLINGHTRAHAELEEAIAAFTGRPRALLFSTGYMANLGVVQALLGRHDVAVADRLNHASLIDAVRLSGCRSLRYRHGALTQVQDLLQQTTGSTRLLITDGVFSMDGDLAPLPELAALAQAHGAWLMVDDAHGIGVLGAQGGGSCAHFGLGPAEVPILVGTFGKALGTSGAFVAGSHTLIEALLQLARSYLFTTAQPPALAVATRVALEIAREEDWRRTRLRERIQQWRKGLQQLGLPLPPGETPIQPLVLQDPHLATQTATALLQRGFLVPAIRPPTVPPGTSRLRVTLTALHTAEQVEALLDALDRTVLPRS